jgi:hypothetical protein
LSDGTNAAYAWPDSPTHGVARGRRWLDEIVSGSVTDVQQIAARQKCSVRQVNMTISLAFLAPDLVRAAVEGGTEFLDAATAPNGIFASQNPPISKPPNGPLPLERR